MARGKSDGFYRLSSGTWGTFSHNGWDGQKKFVFVQRCQDSCLVGRETCDSIWARKHNRESYPDEAETWCPVPLATGKLGFLSIFKRTQVSSHFEELNAE